MTHRRTDAPARSTYRHGRLREALIEAGVDLARSGGPEAVVLREATRRAGVAPNAAYRHFASQRDLLRETCDRARALLADAMEAAAASAPDPLTAVGVAYLRFARTEPGLFLTAFAAGDAIGPDDEPDGAGRSGLGPFEVLARALDQRVAAGALPAERRPGAEFTAWSAVHGLAMLTVKGPLRHLDETQLADIQHHLLTTVTRGL